MFKVPVVGYIYNKKERQTKLKGREKNDKHRKISKKV